MITGIVNANREATIRIVVRGPAGTAQEIDAVIDTGFTGFLTLPSDLIIALGLEWRGREQALLGDGHVSVFDVYAATVLWNGQLRTVETDATDMIPLVGMSLLYGYDVRLQVIDGGLVTIR